MELADMYEAFYGFREKPFSLIPDPDFLYLSKKHSIALALLEYSLVEQTLFSVITGDIGTGKTTLIRHLLNRMDKDVTVGLITNTQPSFGELLQWVLFAFDLDYRNKDKSELYQTLVDFLIAQYAQNRRTVLFFDEAQNMSAETLEELRMLSNLNADNHQVLQVILIGQVGLHETLRRPELEQFAQRIGVDYHLEPLSREETHDYIRHRLKIAGAQNPELFGADACDVVFDYSAGIPRLVNLLCDTALVYGFAEQREWLDAALIEEVARDKQRGEVFPLRAGDELSRASKAQKAIPSSPPGSPRSPAARHVYEAVLKHKQREELAPAEGLDPFSQVPSAQDRQTPVPFIDDDLWKGAVKSEVMAADFGGFDLGAAPDVPTGEPTEPPLPAPMPKHRRARSYFQFTMGAGIGLGIGIVAIAMYTGMSSRFNLNLEQGWVFLNSAKAAVMAGLGYVDRVGSVQPSTQLGNTPQTGVSPETLNSSISLAAQQKAGEPQSAITTSLMANGAADMVRSRIDAPAEDANAVRTEIADRSADIPPADPYRTADAPASMEPVALQSPTPFENQASAGDTPTMLSDKPEPGEPRMVVVKPGDSLSRIIIETYGTYDRGILREVLRKNPHIRRPHWITVGEVITLPAR
jgi:putative secretion ATPase (PEP-CTERM system associated)